jgi:FlaA1/EpsC-like NDP-sugar epimerase
MGASKRFSELILQALAADLKYTTKMTMVRFGNVIGSSGSAIPLFQKQIRDGGPVTVTDPDVIRYFMTIPEAAELVLQAAAMGGVGDVFVLDMGEPIKIFELAKRLISLSGLEVKDVDNPNGDIEIIFTGLRPGEKLYEELLIGDNVSKTEHARILKAQEDFIPFTQLEDYLRQMEEASETGDTSLLKEVLSKAVLGFTPDEKVVDIIYLQENN